MSESNESKTSSDSLGTEEPVKGTTRLQLLFRIFLVVLGMFLIFCTIGYCMPRNYSVETSIIVDAAPEDIYPWIVRLDLWKEWSPAWDFESNEQISNYQFSFDKKAVTWRHEMRGTTSIWISESKTNEHILFHVDDTSLEELEMNSRISLSLTDDGQTEVIWSSETKLPRSPIMSGVFYGWGGLMYNAGLQGQYERDLTRLKDLCEKQTESDSEESTQKGSPRRRNSVTPF